MRRFVGVVFVFILLGGGLVYAQLSCGFIVDLSPPYIDSLYPTDGDTVLATVNFGGTVGDSGAGVWLDYSTSLSMWPSCPSAATYLYWSVNGIPSPDTVWGTTSTTYTFNPGDSVRACIHAIDHIEDYGCSCCPNELDTCWTFYILACDSFWAENTCPDTCGIITSCPDQSMDITIHSYGPLAGDFIGDDEIIVEVDVNGTTAGSGIVNTLTWANITSDSFLTINPITGSWNHGDTVQITIYSTTDCPQLDTFICSFIVDTVSPVLSSFSPADGETLTSAVVNITGNLSDDFAGVASGSTWVSITTYDTLGGVTYDTTYSLGDVFNINRNFNSGDSVVVCVHSVDDVYLQPECTCPPNALDSCWWFIILVSQPYGWVVVPVDSNMDGRVISTCDDQNIIIRVYDSHGMTDSPVRIWVKGTEYTDADAAVSTALYGTSSETLEVSFDPTVAGLTWSDGMWVHFTLDSALNTLGSNIRWSVVDSFLVDLEPPVVSTLAGPGDGDIISADNASGSASAYDSVCGSVPIDSIRVTSTLSGIDQLFTGDTYTISGLVSGDSVTVCAYAHDDCEDYTCLDTSGVYCWTYTVLMGAVNASVLIPIDSTGDGRIISTCDDQQIRWVIDHPVAPINPSTISVRVCGTTYLYPDARLTLVGDTLIFSPDPVWSDLDSCGFCLLTVEDTLGGALPDSVCGWVLIDLSPPYLVASSPADGDTIYSSDVHITASFADSICPDSLDFVDTCWAEAYNAGTLTDTSAGGYDFPLDISGLADGDSVAVCAVVSDGCEDYCSDNVDTICWFFNVLMGEPWGEWITPPDTNADERRITTCDDECFILYVHDSLGMDTTYFHLTVEDVDFHYGDAEVSVSYIGDSTTMEILWCPDTSWLDGAWVNVVLDSAVNLIGNPLVYPVVDSFLVDLSPPTFTYIGPTGITVSDTTGGIAINVSATDAICDGDVALDSLVITAEPSGFYDNWGGVWSGNIHGLADGDSVTVCAYAHDICSDTCGVNYGSDCWTFDVAIGAISADLIIPVDSTGDDRVISACDSQEIWWLINHEYPLIVDSLVVEVCGSTYHWGDAELSMVGDTLIWTPPAGYWSDEDSCGFSLVNICDNTGVCLPAPVPGDVIIDLSPPVFSSEFPADGSVITDSSTGVYILANDVICPDVVYDSLVVSTSLSGSSWVFVDTLGGNVGGFINGDVVTVCAFAHDDCHDYCGDNFGDTCWSFNVALGAVQAGILEPVDLNGDGCIESSCPCQEIQWWITSEYWFDTLSIEAVVDGMTFDWSSGAFIITPITADSALLTFSPADAGTCWNENCYVIDFALTHLVDTLGTDSLEYDPSGSFTMLTEPPIITYDPAPPGTTECLDTLVVDVSVDHSCACSIVENMVVTIDGSVVLSWDSVGTVSIPVISGDTVCIPVSGIVDHDYMCDSLPYSNDPCWYIQCPCNLAIEAGPDQNSCPGADVILGCDPLITGIFDSTHTEWFLAGESTPFITTDNPLVYPDTTTMYIVRVVAYCEGGDSIVEYDTTTVYIDFEPVSTPSIIDPIDGTELTSGTNNLIWNASNGTEPIYYDVILNGVVVADSLTDTSCPFDIACEETLQLLVVAYNQCSYMLDASCNSSIDSSLQTTAAVYETSAVITVWGEPCGGPVGSVTYPPQNTITACEGQNIIIDVWDPAGVDLVPDSFRIHIQSLRAGLLNYDTSQTCITYTATTSHSGEITISPPYGSGEWYDNDTITIWVTDIYNIFGVSGVSDTLVFYTDYSPPYALMVDPLNSADVSNTSPQIFIEIADAVSGVNPDSTVLEISTSDGRIDTMIDFTSGGLQWDGMTLVFDCDSAGIEFMAGETVNVEIVMTCDSPDSGFCEPNCSTYTYWFYYPLIYECDRIPNPFTPNGDGINDYCQFTFPDLSNKLGIIYIYDIYNVLVRKIEVPAGSPKDAARWYGYDDDGNELKEGLYLYAIEVEGTIVCDGTVTIAR
ncbi:gliding motility-associated C-terminal domain-containing protein [bacterium]|nr:gliding motility-associated C-terminal domain-containing protein [bacterium]